MPEVVGGGACAPPPRFEISVNPIWTKGGRLCPSYYYVPPIFLANAASLDRIVISNSEDFQLEPSYRKVLNPNDEKTDFHY